MPVELINNDTHSRLLEKIDRLPFGDAHATVYRKTLVELYGKYNDQLLELFNTIKAYREVTGLVNKRQPLTNRKKYVRVRRKAR